MDERDERMEAIDRTYRYYEIQRIDPPDLYSIEWREKFAINLEKVREDN